MNNYVTGSTIKALRESKKLTQAQLADMFHVGKQEKASLMYHCLNLYQKRLEYL